MFFSNDDDIDISQTRQSKKEISPGKQADTLYLNYADPFLKKKFGDKTQQKPTTTKSNLQQQKKDIPQRPNDIILQYVGYVTEKNNGAISYLIKINGTQQTMKKNDNIDGLKLVGITADSLFFEKENNRYSIFIER
jgi:hypothetical protein